MHAAYLALNRKKTDEYTAAIEFLDNVLERELKRVYCRCSMKMRGFRRPGAIFSAWMRRINVPRCGNS